MELFVEEQYFLEYISTEKAESETLNAVDINYEEIQNEPNGEDEGSIVPTVGLMKCPFCGCEREATSDNWMLIQFPDSTTKYLTCRECGGQNE